MSWKRKSPHRGHLQGLLKEWGGEQDRTRTPPRSEQVVDSFDVRVVSPLRDVEMLRRMYVDEGLSPAQIAKQLKVSKSGVVGRLKRMGVLEGRARRAGYLTGQTPYGWRREKGQLVPHLEEQKVIESMKQMRHEGVSLHAIARILTAQKVPTKRGKRWSAKTVSQVLEHDSKSGLDFDFSQPL